VGHRSYQKSIFKVTTLNFHLAASAHFKSVDVGDLDKMTREVARLFWQLILNSIISHLEANIMKDTKK
jgi:hypothetical protein